VDCYAWSPKGQSSEKSWYAIDPLSFGKEDCPGKNIGRIKVPEKEHNPTLLIFGMKFGSPDVATQKGNVYVE
jgi:hypothetical protein